MVHDVFISYSSKDKEIVDSIYSILESRDIECWIDNKSILPSKSYALSITEGINKSKLFLLILSKNSDTSNHVKNEVSIAFDNNIKILTYVIEDFSFSNDIDYYIRRFQAIKAFFPSIDENVKKLPETVFEIINPSLIKTEETSNNNHYDFYNKSLKTNIKIHYYPEEPPVVDEFVDRITYLESLKGSLNKNMIVIQGIAGIGKTHIAAKFKEIIDSEFNFFTTWKQMINSDTFDTIAPYFAGVFHENDDHELVEYISEGNSDRGIITNIIISSLKKKKYVFFFDNYHEVKNEEIHQLFATLKDINLNSTVVITTRTEPSFVSMSDLIKKTISSETVEGFDVNATKEYLETISVHLNDEQLIKLDRCINGHPLFLSLVASLVNEMDLDKILLNIPGTGIDKYLYDEIYARLDENEQNLLEIMSIFRVSFTADACVHVSGYENIKKTLRILEEKLLVKKKKGKFFYLHDLIRDFSYNQIDNPKEYHRKAAEYYSNLEKNGINISETIYHSTKYSGGLNDDEIKYLIELPNDQYTDFMFLDFLETYPVISSLVYDLLQKMLFNSDERIRYVSCRILVENANLNFERALELLISIIKKKDESDFVLSNIAHNCSVLLNMNVEKCLPLIDEILSKGSEYTVQTLCFAFRDYHYKNQLILERLEKITRDDGSKYSTATKQLASNIAKEIETNDYKSILSAIDNKFEASSLKNIIRENINYSSTIDLLTFSLLLEEALAADKDYCYTLIQDSINNFIPIAILPSYVVSNCLINNNGIYVEIAKKLVSSSNFSFQATAFLTSLQSYSIITFLGRKYKIDDESFNSFCKLIRSQCCEILETFSIDNKNEVSHLSSVLLAEIRQPSVKKNNISEKILGQVSGKISKMVNPNLFKNYADATSFEGNYKEYYRIDFISLMALAGANPYHIINEINEEEKKINIDKIVVPTFYEIVEKSPLKILDIIEVVKQNTHSFVGKYAIITWSYLSLLVTPEQTINFLIKLSADESYQNVELKIEMVYTVNLLRKWIKVINQNSSQNNPELLKIMQLGDDFIQSFKNDEANEVRKFADFVLQ